MQDIVFVVATICFFAVALAYVRGCDRLEVKGPTNDWQHFPAGDLRFDFGVSVRGLVVAGKVLTMTANGWLQIFLFLLVTFAVAKPAGLFMTRVFAQKRPGWTRCCGRWNGCCTADGRGRKARNALDGIHDCDAVVQWRFDDAAICDRARAAMAAVESAEACGSADGSGVQHGGIVYDQYELAGLYPGSHDDLFHADGGAGLSQFHSAAVGIAMAVALIRGIARREQETIGNFWVDLTRTMLWVLLPVCLVVAMIFVRKA